ncbi:Acetyl-CoA acetyltransferase, partial [Pseudomonas syringae pv. cerasicola]
MRPVGRNAGIPANLPVSTIASARQQVDDSTDPIKTRLEIIMSIERTPLHQDPVVIVSAARTPMGGFQGDLQSLSATELGSIAIRAAVERAGIESADVQHVLFGCVLPAGLGQA